MKMLELQILHVYQLIIHHFVKINVCYLLYVVRQQVNVNVRHQVILWLIMLWMIRYKHVIVQAIQLCILMELNVLMYLVNNRINDYLFIEYLLITGIVWFILDLSYNSTNSTSMSRVALINGPGSVPTETKV
jgi:hypothetical protein